MNIFNFQKAIYKYAILLSLGYIIQLIWFYFFRTYFFLSLNELQPPLNDIIHYIPSALDTIFNIIFAILVYKDFKVNKIKSPLIVIITLLFGLIGITLFFIKLIYTDYINNTNTQDQRNPLNESNQ